MTQLSIERNSFLKGKDPLIKTIRDTYPTAHDLSSAPKVQDPIKALMQGKKAQETMDTWLTTDPGSKAANQGEARFVYPTLTAHDGDADHEFGYCLITNVPKGKSGFKCSFLNKKGSDSYVHHVALAAAMENGLLYKYADGEKVSAGKAKGEALTISHLCGNGACSRPVHLLIEKKKVNDERTHCHFLLRRCSDKATSNIVRSVCPHVPRCFVNRYTLNKPYY
jgi:hypothetical protein